MKVVYKITYPNGKIHVGMDAEPTEADVLQACAIPAAAGAEHANTACATPREAILSSGDTTERHAAWPSSRYRLNTRL